MNKNDEVAIRVENVSKSFKIPHEKHSSLKSAALNVFKKKSYTKLEAAKNISFVVKKGEFFGIIGRNGSGKSTLLKMLAGIYTPDSGKITINGKLSPFLELGVGFNPELTARENVFLGGAILGLTRKEIDEKFEEIIKFAELEEFVDMKFKNFSSGMQVRLAFSLAINAHAEILLMDEVLAVGDSNFQTKCLDQFLKYKKEGKTVVLVSHGMDTVEKYCDRVLYLDKGLSKSISSGYEAVNQYKEDNFRLQEKSAKKNRTETDNLNGKSASIKNVELLDGSGKPVDKVVTGGKLVVRVHLNIAEKLGGLKVGISITRDLNTSIYGTNNEKLGVLLPKTNKCDCFVDYIFDQLPLLEGTYQVSVALASDEKTLIDQKSNESTFMVSKGTIRDYGICWLAPKVKFNIKEK